MEVLDKIIDVLMRVMIWMAGFIVVAMILMTCVNIVMRQVWVPVRGTFELMGYGGAIATAFALAYTQVKRGHVAVLPTRDLLEDRITWIGIIPISQYRPYMQ